MSKRGQTDTAKQGRKPRETKAPAKPRQKRAAKPRASAKATAEGVKAPQMKDRPPIATPEGLAKEEMEALIKRYRGRPTKYRPEFCDMVVLWGRLGKSKTWMCAELMVTRQTLENWMADNPDFLDAMELALQLSQLWWEDKGQNSLTTVGFQGSVYSRSMAARFPKDWTERKDTNVNLTSQEDWLKKLAAAEASGELD